MEPTELYAALNTKAGFEVVNEKLTDTQLRISGRVPNAQTATWLMVVKRLDRAAKRSAKKAAAQSSTTWTVDISKQYFTVPDVPDEHEDDDNARLLYAWRIIIQGEDIQQHIPTIARVVQRAPRVRAEVTEVPLHAAGSRNAPIRGRGAQLTESRAGGASVGPIAIMRQKLGG